MPVRYREPCSDLSINLEMNAFLNNPSAKKVCPNLDTQFQEGETTMHVVSITASFLILKPLIHLYEGF